MKALDDLTLEDWRDAFSKIRVRSSESFSHLLCDVDDDKESRAKKEVLYRILFMDHKSSSSWYEYCMITIKQFPSRKLQLQRLINKALDACAMGGNVGDLARDKSFALLHSALAQLKSDDECLRHYEEVIWKKEIGLDVASIYLDWASVELRRKGDEAEAKKRALAVLQRGVDKWAEPKNVLLARIKELSIGAFDDGEVAFAFAKVSDIGDATYSTSVNLNPSSSPLSIYLISFPLSLRA